MTRAATFALSLALAAILPACPRTDGTAARGAGDASDASNASDANDGGSAATEAPAAKGDAEAPSAASAGTTPWTEALRMGLYAEAEEAMRKLPSAEARSPEVRYARARIALALGKHDAALAALEHLEDDLPLLRDSIAKARAQASMLAGRFEPAAEWYAGRPVPSAWLIAAEAWEKAGQLGRARSLCDRVIAAEKRTRAQEERARAMRMRLVHAVKAGDAADDAHWLAVHAVDEATARDANLLLDKIPTPKANAPRRTLTADDLLARARLLSDVGRADDAIRAIERAERTAGLISPTDLCRARADALYKARTRYVEAAQAWQKCAALGGVHAAEDSFLAARSLSRADRDTDALAAFAEVVQRYPKSTWAEQADFHIARTHALGGRWREASIAFDDYAKRYRTGREKTEAARYRAIAHLMARDDKVARSLLEELAGTGEDPIAQARWTNLAAIAARNDGDRTHALARWAEVARSHPLTWPALVARARIKEANAEPPPLIEPAAPAGADPPLAVELPPPVDLLHRIGLDTEAEEALREREGIVVTVAPPGRTTEALCMAYGKLDRAKRQHQFAWQVPARLLATAPGPRNRWAWECVYPRPYDEHVRAREKASHLPTNLLWAVMRHESAFDAEVVSPARAVGLLQLMPETARVVATQAKIPHEDDWLVRPPQNIALGGIYMRDLIDRLGGNTALAVGAYNAGPEAIERWRTRAKGEPLDVFVETIPFLETRAYVVRVMGSFARYGFLDRGDEGVPSLDLDLSGTASPPRH